MEKFVASLGDMTDRVWDVKKKDADSITFKSRDQFRSDACAFSIAGKKYDDWKVEPLSYNDFGGDYKHVASKNYREDHP